MSQLFAPAAGRPFGADPSLTDLRRARRTRRLGAMSRTDTAYTVYVTALITIFAVYLAVDAVGDEPVSAHTAARVAADGPTWLGLLTAVLLWAGVRSGRRGGPLAVEAAEVHHVLLSPHDRSGALVRPAMRVVAVCAGAGAALGVLSGELASQRLPGDALAWTPRAAFVGSVMGLLTAGAALLTGGRTVHHRWGQLLGAALTAWSAAELYDVAPAAPLTWLARLAFPSSDVSLPVAIGAGGVVVAALAACVLGVRGIGGLSIEQARRRTVLIGQLRFAVGQQDLRGVLLLRRQLAAEQHRGRPWFPGLPSVVADRVPVFARDVHSIARWPLVRILRVAALGVVAGVCSAGVWQGTSPLVVVAGIALFVAALDAIEPLAQELDHPQRVEALPAARGVLFLQHLVQPVLLMTLVTAVAVGVATALEPDPQLAGAAALLAVPGAAAAVAGAAVSLVSEPSLDESGESMLPPEVAGPRVLFRTAWPPGVAVIGQLPLLAAANAASRGEAPLPALQAPAIAVAVLVVVVFAWVRFRDDIRRSLAEAAAAGGRSR